ncbi:hypothetical protein CLOLEP_02508 [[Clostridium] leptum DSM 753]|uniref:Uncharacterized protein n=1 Tax=[Clostridium] leptum DSM 753 TaxID=428125 RepID=A7VV96_9FIRM|nr:hypothetical protein CLOLEP_02508 [[Clostridium] leptum DSM 753]
MTNRFDPARRPSLKDLTGKRIMIFLQSLETAKASRLMLVIWYSSEKIALCLILDGQSLS